jgi:hypothetical protein
MDTTRVLHVFVQWLYKTFLITIHIYRVFCKFFWKLHTNIYVVYRVRCFLYCTVLTKSWYFKAPEENRKILYITQVYLILV